MNRQPVVGVWVVLALWGVFGVSFLLAEVQEHAPSEAPPASAGFEALKGLAGTWEGTADHDGQATPAAVSYKVTAGGTTVIETTFEGTEHEMVTVYRMDGDRLVMTHYCMVNNQPTMAVEDASDAQRLHFRCTGDGYRGMASEEEGHMHDVVMRFVDDDHVLADWTFYEKGEPGHVAKLDIKRVAQ